MKEKTSWGIGNVLAIIILGAIVILGGHFLGRGVSQNQTESKVAGISEFTPVVEKVISYDGEEGKTALDLLKQSHQVKAEETSTGVFVNSIDDTENQSDKFWMFYVNGQLAPVGADQYITKNGEKIEWRYEAF
ncbi:MAG: DUF4430 domain-containing protein [Patescibacteria group bacterium]